MASEPIFVGPPTEGTRSVEALFVPDDEVWQSKGVWLVEFANGVIREFPTEAGYMTCHADLCNLTQWQVQCQLGLANRR